MTVYETDVPGVGRKFEVEVGGGARAVVLLHHAGRVEVFRRPSEDADSEKVFELTSQQANYLGSILEGAYFETVDMDQLSVPLGDAVIEWVDIAATSRVAGQTLAEADLRAVSGVSVIAVQRGPDTIPNPDPGFRVEADDILVTLGTREQQAVFADRCQGGEESGEQADSNAGTAADRDDGA
jgi:TrkA domain protein